MNLPTDPRHEPTAESAQPAESARAAGPPGAVGPADPVAHAHDLGAFISASPSSFHAAAEGRRRLLAAGFGEVDEAAAWPGAGAWLLRRDGALVAWRVPAGAGPHTRYVIVGAHTDSPGFALKPRPDIGAYGWQQLGMEIYGGPLLNSWLDRELGLAGRLVLRDGEERLVRTGPVMRIPQLAIHLDRTVGEDGLRLDRQQHTQPIWSVRRRELSALAVLADAAGCEASAIGGVDIVAYDTCAPQIFGPYGEFLAAGRLDDLAGVHAGVTALAALGRPQADQGDHGIDHGFDQDGQEVEAIVVLAAFDHEEIGSETRSGAAGPLLGDVLARINGRLGGSGDDLRRALARSWCLSADAGHAVHPNYASRHDPANHPLLGGGPLLKLNANQRYATDAHGAARWREACARAGVATQEFVSNNAIPCGSTIGPITATRLGIRTVDVGIPLLSMHSARELAGVADPAALTSAIGAFCRLPG